MKLYKNTVKVGGRPLTVVTINQEESETTQVVETMSVPACHHIHVLDRSGSMSGQIRNLIEQVKKTLTCLGPDDLISIVWFASPGQYRTLVKGAKNTPELLTLLDSLKSTLGCTCFSDPIKEVKTIVEELSSLNPNIVVTLFTDGQPVCPWGSSEEESRTISLVKSLRDKIIAFNTVGYSNYYNQDFLKTLSACSEFGIFTHSSNIEEYSQIFTNNFEKVSSGKIESVHIEFPLTVDGIYLNRKFTKMEKLEIYLSRLDKQKNQFFLVSDSEFNFIYNGTNHESKNIPDSAPDATVTNFLYAYAYGLYYANRRRPSLEILAHLRDKALVDSHMASFTFDECANHQTLLETAALSHTARFLEGECKANYLPAKNAFCVIDVLNELATNDAFYLPFHAEAEDYERIGKKATETQSLFTYTKDVISTPFSEFVFNKDKANLSIRIRIPGEVALDPKAAADVGLPTRFSSYVWRNHTFIKNGILNVKKCIAVMPQRLFDAIQSRRKILESLPPEQICTDLAAQYGTPYVLARINFTRLPVINASYLEDVTASKLFQTCSRLLDLECYQKYVNHYWKRFEASASASQLKLGAFEEKSVAQIKVLEAHGVDKSGAYVGLDKSVPKNEDCDFYETRSFEFVFKGVSSLPSVADVAEKVAAKKETVSVQKMNGAHLKLAERARKEGIVLDSPTVATRDWLLKEQQGVRGEIFHIRSELCALKMAKLLNGDNFEGFTLDAKKNLVYEKGDETLILKMERVKEYF